MLDRYQFSKLLRLRTTRDFQEVFADRRRIRSRFFLIYYRSSSTRKPRLGVITGKRNLKLAVKRNRIRRIVREQFRLIQHKLAGYDIIVIANREAGTATNKELIGCLQHLFEKSITS